ncbi:glycosyltransferase family A protein [Paenibacillus macquariensis]|uniref:Glycosyltransferase 2-like domain-containing protein n=1 Tax=Paenibacillus macquariensis TaxID=948756 RepID=A0ABY1K6U6_9BACL|nr:glycosyltransferase family A protein [Paenibacillus macquariensis]MEC0092578.1 glycosyltransferase family A protein [Paenibacillus macquariensis]OAB35526.1 hypothetical protein PMSM_09755 [Paenibacillus macquariensis subsp. macquariensis]SIR34265.1 hypothetical protein SAMN05421578_11190 [Paenibacillus macquariensis]
MVIQLIWIAVIYGLAIAIVHGLYATTYKVKGNRRKEYHNDYILVTYNHERKIEWYIRALWLYAFQKGKTLRVLVIDQGSSDETVSMIHTMRDWSGLDLSVKVCAGVVDGDDMLGYLPLTSTEGPIWIDLRIPQEDRRIPYVQG